MTLELHGFLQVGRTERMIDAQATKLIGCKTSSQQALAKGMVVFCRDDQLSEVETYKSLDLQASNNYSM